MNLRRFSTRYIIPITLLGLFSCTITPTSPEMIPAKNNVAVALGALAAGVITVEQCINYHSFLKLSRWDWEKIGTDNGKTPNINYFNSEAFYKEFGPCAFPTDFLFGAGNSALQSEGYITNSTYNHPLFAKKYSDLQGAVNSEWVPEEFTKTVNLITTLNQNAHRNNIEWSRIQPTPDTFDMEVLNEYARRYAELIKNGITPLIGFHHYSDPAWFMWPDGNTNNPVGFEKKENTKYYINFCTIAFTVINDACQKALDELHLTNAQRALLEPRWLTFNSPGAYAVNGYYQGERPPAISNEMNRSFIVNQNMLNAHDEVYWAIKKINPKTLVSTTLNFYQADPYLPKTGFLPVRLLKFLGGYVTSKFANTVSNSMCCHYFTDGQLTALLPTKGSINVLRYLQARWNRFFFDKKHKTLDFICINYYSHGYAKKFGPPDPATDELKTANERYTIYAEGLYRAIKEVYERVAQPLGIPIYITENGFSQNNIIDQDGKPVDGEERRILFLNRHLYAIARAIKDGYPVKGYMYWSLYDNCEWAEGYKKNYGLATRDKIIKPSGRYYAQIIARFRPAHLLHN